MAIMNIDLCQEICFKNFPADLGSETLKDPRHSGL